MAASSESKGKGKVALILFLIGLGITIAFEAIVVSCGNGYWIELFNGATWPSQFQGSTHNFWFYFLLGLRTLLNLGIVLTAVYGLYWVLAGGPRRLIVRNLDSVLRIRDLALTGYIIDTLGEKNISLPPEIIKELYAAAREFDATAAGKHFADEASKSSKI